MAATNSVPRAPTVEEGRPPTPVPAPVEGMPLWLHEYLMRRRQALLMEAAEIAKLLNLNAVPGASCR